MSRSVYILLCAPEMCSSTCTVLPDACSSDLVVVVVGKFLLVVYGDINSEVFQMLLVVMLR